MARNIALIALSLTLGLLFVVIGSMKLTPMVSKEIHKEMKSTFKRARAVFPFYPQTGWRPKSSQYRRFVGTVELVCGLILMFIPGRLKTMANLVLLGVMLGAIYTHWALDEDLKHFTGAIIFSLLLSCRLVIQMQSSRPVETAIKED